MRLQTLKNIFEPDYVVIAIMLAMVLFLGGIYNWKVSFENETFTDIRSPVELTSHQYQIGDAIKGRFIGEIRTPIEATIGRTLQCANQRIELEPITISSEPRILTGEPTPIYELGSQRTITGAFVEPDEFCIIAFSNVYCENFLGIRACNTNTRYYTDSFDIVE